jgi:hypothetical protein
MVQALILLFALTRTFALTVRRKQRSGGELSPSIEMEEQRDDEEEERRRERERQRRGRRHAVR